MAQLEVFQPDVDQRLQLAGDLRDVLEQPERLGDVQFEDVRDRVPLELHAQRFAVVPVALTHRTRHPDVRQKIHLQLGRPVAVARGAPSAVDVEREPAGGVSPRLGLVHLGEQVSDLIEHLHVSRRVAPRRASDRALVDRDDLVQVLDAGDRIVVADVVLGLVQRVPQGRLQDAADQRAFAAARHPGHARHHAQRDVDVDVLQVVVPRAVDRQLEFVHDRPQSFRHGDLAAARQELTGQRLA